MEENKYDAAFPDQYNNGISKREYFAAKAMQTLLSGYRDPSKFIEGVARLSYEMADEMIKHYNK